MTTRKFGLIGLRYAATVDLGVAAGTAVTLAAHRRALGLVREQAACTLHHADLAVQQCLHWELLSKAIDSPELAEVLDIFEEPLTPQKRRQYLFANALYTNVLFYYRMGNINRDEFFGYMRGLLQNSVVREYWHATRGQRATIMEDSDEAVLGHMIDDLLRQLEDADTDEWWVVGEPPTTQ